MNIKVLVTKLAQNQLLSRVLHTFWQGALAFVIYAVVVNHVPLAHVSDVRALGLGAIAAGLSALRILAVQLIKSYRG